MGILAACHAVNLHIENCTSGEDIGYLLKRPDERRNEPLMKKAGASRLFYRCYNCLSLKRVRPILQR